MRILITGSKGVIGQRLMTELQKQNEVFGIDLFHADGETGYIQEMGYSGGYARCDIGEFRQLERVLQGFDIVYNCAAEFGRWNGEDYYEQLWRSNVVGLKNILRLQEKQGFKLIHFSSSEVYGDYQGVMKENIMNEIEIKQLNDYAMSKWVNEMQIRNSESLFGTQTVIIRLFNLYGNNEYYHSYRGAVCKFCYHAIHNLPVIVYRGHKRTSLHLWDAVNAMVNIKNNFRAGEVYNISSTREHTMEDIVEIIWQYTGADKSLINYKDSELLTTKTKKADNKKAIRDLTLIETICLKEGIEKTVDWMRKYYNKYDN